MAQRIDQQSNPCRPDPHPLYSQTRHAWILAAELQLPEVVQSLHGHEHITSKQLRDPPHQEHWWWFEG
ncbi:MAG TPA: hypothetical protein PLR25_10465 [Planctomycetaceae bacterium]|nr:hypothetical protein [Planctomycetaceae bacterium]